MSKKILIVEDDRGISELLALALRRENYEPYQCYTAEEALKKLSVVKVDLIILDVMLPDITGIELLKDFKNTPALSKIPVVMCTDKNLIKDVDEALGLGADNYITKPFDIERVLNKVAALIGR